MKNNSALERLYNGIIKENPTLVLILFRIEFVFLDTL